MNYIFQGQSYPTMKTVIAACAREWLTAGGDNNPQACSAVLRATNSDALACECADDWKLDEALNGWGATIYDLEDAFEGLRDEFDGHGDAVAA